MSSTVPIRGGCLILLDVPPSSSITIDGITRVTPSSQTSHPDGFNRGLFIVDNIPSELQFHLLVVRSGNEKSNSNPGSLPVGFVMLSDASEGTNCYGYDWVFARRYDKQTEEISNEPLDEVTTRNLVRAITEESGELRKYTMSYEQFMGVSPDNCKSVISWKTRTTLINVSYLKKQHDLVHGDKIVPSSDASCESETSNTQMKSSNTVIDGKPTSYPGIPCITSTISARQLMRHAGTKSYISKLDANTRTWLLSGGACNVDVGDQTNQTPEEYVWNDILNKHYNTGNVGQNEDYFLADVQFAFLIFLFMECHSSLEHWRDSVSMSSLSIRYCLAHKPTFVLQLLSTLYAQLSCIEADFFQETEYSSGESNFLIGALRRLCIACDASGETDQITEMIKKASIQLQKMTVTRFHIELLPSSKPDLTDCDIDMTTDAYATECGDNTQQDSDEDDEEMDDEDGPVIVPNDEVEASISRSSLDAQYSQKYGVQINKDIEQHRKEYPLLFAAVTPHEDVVMACARILDAGNDVSLVREAAAYLEDVEAYRR